MTLLAPLETLDAEISGRSMDLEEQMSPLTTRRMTSTVMDTVSMMLTIAKLAEPKERPTRSLAVPVENTVVAETEINHTYDNKEHGNALLILNKNNCFSQYL